MLKRLILFLVLAVVSFSSCRYYTKNEHSASLEKAAEVMDKAPQEALSLLRQVAFEELGRADYHYYILLQARAKSLAGFDVSFMEETILKAIHYFTKKLDAPKLVFGYYILAKLHEKAGESTKAEHYYHSADDWAAKAGYSIPSFIYPSVPYNIAHYYNISGLYDKSVSYLHKALEHSSSEDSCHYHLKQYTLELLALNFLALNNSDSAFFYYDAAELIATERNDTLSLDRIACNRIITLAGTNDSQAEQKATWLLMQSTDSLFIGFTSLALSKLYYNASRLPLADKYVYKAKSYLANVDKDDRLMLLDQLRLVEEQKGNHTLANSYLQQHNLLSKELEQSRLALEKGGRSQEQELLAESMQLEAHTYMSLQSYKFTQKILLGIIAAFIIVVILLFRRKYIRYRSVLQAENSRHEAVLWEVGKKDLLNKVSKRFMLSELRKDIRRLLGDDRQKSILLSKVSDIYCIEELPNSIKNSYVKCYSTFQNACPTLSSAQLSICSFLYLNLLSHGQVIRYLGVTPEEYKSMVDSINIKMQNIGSDFRVNLDSEINF